MARLCLGVVKVRRNDPGSHFFQIHVPKVQIDMELSIKYVTFSIDRPLLDWPPPTPFFVWVGQWPLPTSLVTFCRLARISGPVLWRIALQERAFRISVPIFGTQEERQSFWNGLAKYLERTQICCVPKCVPIVSTRDKYSSLDWKLFSLPNFYDYYDSLCTSFDVC